MSRLPKPLNSEYSHFGHVLRHYRETISDRLQQKNPGLAPIQASALDLIRCLNSHGYQISPATYSALENGESLPRDPETFIDRVCECLAIDHGSEDWWTLTLYAMHGLMAQKLGGQTANAVISVSKSAIHELWEKSH